MGAFLRRTAPLCCGVLAALAFAGAPSATAATPCGEAVILDWSDGTIDRAYSVSCYRDALARLPEDLRAYSTAPEDIERALLERARADASSPQVPAGQAEPADEAPRSLAGPAGAATTAEEEDAEGSAAGPPETQPPASGGDDGADVVAAPVNAEPDASTKAPGVVAAALALLAVGAAIPLLRALSGRRRGT